MPATRLTPSSGQPPDDGLQALHAGRSTAGLLLAAEQAVDVGAGILRRGRSHIGALIDKGDRDFATDVDLQIETAVKTALRTATADIPFLGEEHGAGAAQADGPCWVLDPIDGTINFAKDSPLCAISLSLVVGGQPILGIVDTPFIGERFIARAGDGAYMNGARITITEVHDLREAVIGLADFKVGVGSEEENRVHLALLGHLARESLRVRMHGSAALDLAWLAAGRLHATVMLSNLPWDVTAGLLLVREAGGVAFDYDGSVHGPASRFTLASAPSLAGRIQRMAAEAM